METFLSIIFFIFSFIVSLKNVYKLLAITKVWIPEFNSCRKLFIDDYPLRTLKKQRIIIVCSYFILVLIVYLLMSLLTFKILVASIIASFIIGNITFNASIYENNLINIFNQYIK